VPDYRTTLSPNGMGQYWKSVPDVGGRRASVSFPFESPDLGRSAAGSTSGDISGFEWDDEIIDQYVILITPTVTYILERFHKT